MRETDVKLEFGFEMYGVLMSILDAFAQYGKPLTKEWETVLNIIAKGTDISGDVDIGGISDGNDCGICETWEEFIKELRTNMLIGERIYHNKWTGESHRIDVYDWETNKIVEPTDKEDDE